MQRHEAICRDGSCLHYTGLILAYFTSHAHWLWSLTFRLCPAHVCTYTRGTKLMASFRSPSIHFTLIRCTWLPLSFADVTSLQRLDFCPDDWVVESPDDSLRSFMKDRRWKVNMFPGWASKILASKEDICHTHEWHVLTKIASEWSPSVATTTNAIGIY